MHQLYFHPLCPHSRFVRLVLAEKGLNFDKLEEPFWQRREGFMRLSPAGTLPVLVDPTGVAVRDAAVIAEYLEETVATPPLLGSSPRDRAEVRSLVHWFTDKFAAEVANPIMGERVWKRLSQMGTGQGGTPDTNLLRNASYNIRYHLSYIRFLAERRVWLAGDYLSLADLAAAAMLSSLDYLGHVPWDEAGEAKDWYSKIKCRPSFRPLLGDHLPGLPPSSHYTNLDF